MSTKIIDLDELVQEPKQVELKGKVYKLPGELPVPFYLRLKAAEEASAAGELGEDRIEGLSSELLELFQEHQPDLKALPPLGLVQLFRVIPRVYAAVDEGDEADPNPSTPSTTRARRGSGSGRKAPRKKT